MKLRISPDSVLHNGPIPKDLMERALEEWKDESHIGGVVTFAGVVRADQTEKGSVRAIEFTAYEEMVDSQARELIEREGDKLGLAEDAPVRVHLQHALGEVRVGEIAVLLVVGTGHRPEAFDLCRRVLEVLKSEMPIFGKELIEEGSFRWKENT